MKIETNSQPNFQYVTIEKDTPVVSFLLTADCFTNNSPERTAVFLLYTDLLLAGAGKYNRDDFLYALNTLGTDVAISENHSRITISIKTLATNLSKTLKLLEIALTSPHFNEIEFVRAKESSINSLKQYQEEARALAHDALCRTLYQKDDKYYEFSPEVVIESLQTVEISQLKELHEQLMRTFWFVSIGGQSTAVKFGLDFVTKIKTKQASVLPLSHKTSFQKVSGKKLVTGLVASKQNIELSIGGQVPLTMMDDELAPLSFGLAVLGKWGGFAGRLMSTVREKEGLTYGIYARLEGITKTEFGHWRIMTFFAPKDVITGINSTLREIKKIHDQGITVSEWERFRVILKTSETLAQDSLSGMVGVFHGAMVSGLSFDEYKQYRERLYTCSRSEVNKALKKYLNPENLIISTFGPVDKIEKELKGIVKK